jgi:hypothetical protein
MSSHAPCGGWGTPALSAAVSRLISSINEFRASMVGGKVLETKRRSRVRTDTPCFCRLAASALDTRAGTRAPLEHGESACSRRSAILALRKARKVEVEAMGWTHDGNVHIGDGCCLLTSHADVAEKRDVATSERKKQDSK